VQVKVTKPQLEQQVRDEVNNIVIHRQHSLRCLPKLSVDTTDVSYHITYLFTQTVYAPPNFQFQCFWFVHPFVFFSLFDRAQFCIKLDT